MFFDTSYFYNDVFLNLMMVLFAAIRSFNVSFRNYLLTVSTKTSLLKLHSLLTCLLMLYCLQRLSQSSSLLSNVFALSVFYALETLPVVKKTSFKWFEHCYWEFPAVWLFLAESYSPSKSKPSSSSEMLSMIHE